MSIDDTSWQRVKELVADVLERPSAERCSFLDGLQEETPEVLERVRHLVSATEESDDPLEEAAGNARIPSTPLMDWAGKSIGGFTVKRFLARGGMGEVYEAVQDATGRRVALKLLSANSTKEWRTRFRHEVGILARLEHPAIAQILGADVQVDAHGREWPYIVLEYIDGEPLTTYAREQGLSTNERIRLLLEVCGGVQHAHQRGVIHRDLKPENILVTSSGDGTTERAAQPKVLDFGVARVFGDDAEHITQLTREGELVGTLSYMSPEQVLGLPAAVDTRSDVHGLGVLLFQLLTDRLPIDLSGIALPEAVQRLREGIPATPSSIVPELRGDLDTICATAMAREREARYQSVSEFAADLGRFLRREPISARPASRVYHLRMFARRNRGLVAGFVLATIVLVIGSISTTVGFVYAREEARRATAEASRTRDANRFLGEILSAVDPAMLGKDATLRDVLNLNAPRIDKVFANDDRTRAELHSTAGWTYHNLGEEERALKHLATSRDLIRTLDGPDSPTALTAERLWQTVSLEVEGTSDEALQAARSLVDRSTRLLGSAHPDTLNARTDLAFVLAGREEQEEALEIVRAAHDESREEHGRGSQATSDVGEVLGAILIRAGEFDDAASVLRELYDWRVERYGASHPRTLHTLLNLATADSMADRPEQALAAFDSAIADARKIWDEEHPLMTLLASNRASALSGLGQYEEAVAAYEVVHDLHRRRLGDSNSQTLSVLYNLAVNLAYCERFEDAESAARQLLAQAVNCEGCDEEFTIRATGLLSGVLSDLERDEEAALFSQQSLDEHHRLFGPHRYETVIQSNNHAHLLGKLERFDESIQLFEWVLSSWQEQYPEITSVLRTFRWNYARVLADAGRSTAAEAEFRLLLDQELDAGPNPRPTRIEVLERMAELLVTLNRTSDASACRAEIESLEGSP